MIAGKEGEHYVVQGKGGLIREVVLSKDLAKELESLRRTEPLEVVDRKVKYQSYYDISGGNKFSKSFSAASKRALGFSTGVHSLRHDLFSAETTHLYSLVCMPLKRRKSYPRK